MLFNHSLFVSLEILIPFIFVCIIVYFFKFNKFFSGLLLILSYVAIAIVLNPNTYTILEVKLDEDNKIFYRESTVLGDKEMRIEADNVNVKFNISDIAGDKYLVINYTSYPLIITNVVYSKKKVYAGFSSSDTIKIKPYSFVPFKNEINFFFDTDTPPNTISRSKNGDSTYVYFWLKTYSSHTK